MLADSARCGYPRRAAKSVANRCVYRFSIRRSLCPVMLDTSSAENPCSASLDVASWRRSCKRRSSKNRGSGVSPFDEQSWSYSSRACLTKRFHANFTEFGVRGNTRSCARGSCSNAATAFEESGVCRFSPFLVSLNRATRDVRLTS